MIELNIEALMIDFLNEHSIAPTYATRPDDAEDPLITVERVGGSSDGFMDRPMIAVQCWASTRSKAFDLANKTKTAISDHFVDGFIVTRAELTGFSNFPTDKGEPRYQLAYSIVAYER